MLPKVTEEPKKMIFFPFNGESASASTFAGSYCGNSLILVEIPPTETDKKAEVGELSESEDRDTYDLETLTGAYQYIVSYCWDNWKAPAVFVTGIQEGKKDAIYDMRQAVWPVKYGMDHTAAIH